MLTKVLDGTTLYCPRPQYRLTKLDASISQRGISLAPETLLGHSPAQIHLDADGRLWLSDFVSPEELYRKLVDEPMWFPSVFDEREKRFEILRHSLPPLVTELRTHSLEMSEFLQALQKLIELQTTFLSFVYLPLIDDYLADRLKDLVSRFANKNLAQEYMFGILNPPSHFREAIKQRIVFDEKKTLSIPPDLEPFFVAGDIELRQEPLLLDAQIAQCFPEQLVLSGFADIVEFARLRAIVPVLFQIGQEDLFLGKEIVVALSNCIYDIARILVSNGRLNSEVEILGLNVEELFALADKI